MTPLEELVTDEAQDSIQFAPGAIAQAGAIASPVPPTGATDTQSEPPPTTVGVLTPDPPIFPTVQNGARLVAADGRAYVVSHVRSVPLAIDRDGARQVVLEPFALTLRRAEPKVRGKRARTLEKRARAALRRTAAHAARVAAVSAACEREAPEVDW